MHKNKNLNANLYSWITTTIFLDIMKLDTKYKLTIYISQGFDLLIPNMMIMDVLN